MYEIHGKGAIFCTITTLLCNRASLFLKKICVTDRKCVTLHPQTAKGRKNVSR
jgi:hypothetical protein